MKVSLDLKITDDNGADFYSGGNTWSNMPRENVIEMEAMLIKFMADLNAVAKAKQSEKK